MVMTCPFVYGKHGWTPSVKRRKYSIKKTLIMLLKMENPNSEKTLGTCAHKQKFCNRVAPIVVRATITASTTIVATTIFLAALLLLLLVFFYHSTAPGYEVFPLFYGFLFCLHLFFLLFFFFFFFFSCRAFAFLFEIF